MLIAAVALGLIAGPAASQEPPPAPDRPLANAAQEARAQALFDGIRCVVCQHEAIGDSPAVIAADMRGLVREQMAAGRSDAEIKRDLVRRYGDFVLFQPPVRVGTWLLWFGPFLIALAVAAVLLLQSRRRRTEIEALSPDEEARLADIMAEVDVRPDPDAKASDD
nr:cytochrome c-type biogenesis protein [Brevundimonas alba]